LSPGSVYLTLQASGAHTKFITKNAGNSSVNYWDLYGGSTNLWELGLQGDGTNNYKIYDVVGGKAVVNLPSNVMPANSLGGNVYGATAITQPAADNSTNIATDAFVRTNLPLAGTTGSIGGSALAAGACTSGTVNVTGATTSMAVVATPATYPGDGMAWRPYVSGTGIVTVKVCADVAGTPTASIYNVRVMQ